MEEEEEEQNPQSLLPLTQPIRKLDKHREELLQLWCCHLKEIHKITDFTKQIHYQLPLGRIKKFTEADLVVRKVSAEAVAMIAKLCEYFILELTIESWRNVVANNRLTLENIDIGSVILDKELLLFLLDLVPINLLTVKTKSGEKVKARFTETSQCYYPRIGHPAGAAGGRMYCVPKWRGFQRAGGRKFCPGNVGPGKFGPGNFEGQG